MARRSSIGPRENSCNFVDRPACGWPKGESSLTFGRAWAIFRENLERRRRVRTTWGLRARPSRRALIWFAVVAAVIAGLSAWRLQGSAEAQASESVATATRGPIVVTVGGVGQIVDGLWGPRAGG